MKRLLAVLVVALTTASCGTTSKFVYPASPRGLEKITDMPKYNFRVAVLPFEELRRNKNQVATAWLGYIPLVPFGFVTYERPDAAENFLTVRKFDFDVSEDMAKAVVSSLKRSGLFKDVFFTFGGDREIADLVVQGEINSAIYKGRMYTYCLSFFGPLLWSIGLPAGSSNNQLDFALALKDRRTGKVVWNYQSRNETSVTQGLYYNWGYDVKGYAKLMQDGMNKAVRELDRAMATYQKSGISPGFPERKVTEQESRALPITKEQAMVTLLEKAGVYSGPGSDHMILGAIPAGARIMVLEEKSGWFRFSSELFKTGWIHERYTDKGQEKRKSQVTIISLARVYSGPSSDYIILGAIPAGAKIKVLEKKDGWYRFSSELFETGWIHERFTDRPEKRHP